MLKNKKLYIAILVLIGLFSVFIPFTPILLLELFVLVPVALLVIFCLFIFFIGLITRDKTKKEYPFKILLFIMFPLIVSAIIQLISIYSVKGYNDYRAKALIEKLEEYKTKTNIYPKKLDENLATSGIHYYYYQSENEYELFFSRDFLNNQVYKSKTKEWETKPTFD